MFGNIDCQLFRLIHEGLKNPLFDFLMPFFSNPFPHWKVLSGIIWAGFLVFGPRRWRLILLFLAIAIGVSDFLSSQVIKEIVRRPRPFGGETFSFPSSHAVNFFCGSTFLFLHNRRLWPLFIVGFFVGLSRVYLGSHYPFDVLGGIAIGVVLAFVTLVVKRAVAGKMPPRLRRLFPPPEERPNRQRYPTHLDARPLG